MKAKITAVLLIAALGASFITACGTVDSADGTSSPVADTTAADTSADDTTSTDKTEASTEITSEEKTTAEADTTASNKDNSGENPTKALDTATQPDPEQPKETAPAETPTDAPAANKGSFSHNDMIFLYGNAEAALFSEASGLVSALGTPSDVMEAPGCLSNGADQKIYSYSGLKISTYVLNGQEFVYDIEITSSAYTTSEGLTVGKSVADMESLYGTGYQKSGNMYIYTDTASEQMYITVSGDTITAIEYYGEV